MSKLQVVERLRNHGVMVEESDSDTKALRALREHEIEALWPIVEDFMQAPIGIDFANERMHSLTLSYAIVDAFHNGNDYIDQNAIDTAFKKAAAPADMMAIDGSTRPDPEREPDSITVSDDGSVQVKAKRKRDRGLQPLIEQLVQDNPNAQGAEIVEMVQRDKPDAVEGTIKVYYSKARKAMGLPTIGKRGRQAKN